MKVHLRNPKYVEVTTCGQSPWSKGQKPSLSSNPYEVDCKGCHNHKTFRAYKAGWDAHSASLPTTLAGD